MLENKFPGFVDHYASSSDFEEFERSDEDQNLRRQLRKA
jgi:hypothetical protein